MMILAALCSCAAPEKKVEKAAVQPGAPPKGAVVLFDGKDTSAWEVAGGKPVGWTLLGDGSMEVVPKSGSITTKEKFQDFQLHVEFWLPKLAPEVKSQARANSGVYLQGRYEIQVLDSYHNDTYPMGGCGAIYKKKDPDHFDQAVRPPETWNTYDVTFRAARFDAAGKKTENAHVTVLWNGVKAHDNVEITGPTSSKNEPATTGPITLQDHGNRVRYRNVWIVPITEGEKR
jgi:hypothetical protein